GGACEPAGDQPCDLCTAESCCDELLACAADEDCTCFIDCLSMGIGGMECVNQCNVNPMMNEALGGLRTCRMMNCQQECFG
ncbi:MAG: hypothetical protein KC457_01375, partial [Myxococcales bacterium]|nr:hypothetical protein [Myxococcales bacterium]